MRSTSRAAWSFSSTTASAGRTAPSSSVRNAPIKANRPISGRVASSMKTARPGPDAWWRSSKTSTNGVSAAMRMNVSTSASIRCSALISVGSIPTPTAGRRTVTAGTRPAITSASGPSTRRRVSIGAATTYHRSASEMARYMSRSDQLQTSTAVSSRSRTASATTRVLPMPAGPATNTVWRRPDRDASIAFCSRARSSTRSASGALPVTSRAGDLGTTDECADGIHGTSYAARGSGNPLSSSAPTPTNEIPASSSTRRRTASDARI